jgi:hypothetical protein
MILAIDKFCKKVYFIIVSTRGRRVLIKCRIRNSGLLKLYQENTECVLLIPHS